MRELLTRLSELVDRVKQAVEKLSRRETEGLDVTANLHVSKLSEHMSFRMEVEPKCVNSNYQFDFDSFVPTKKGKPEQPVEKTLRQKEQEIMQWIHSLPKEFASAMAHEKAEAERTIGIEQVLDDF